MGEQTACKQIEREYSALCKGQRLAEIRRVPHDEGDFVFHGDAAADEDGWSLTYERARDRAVLPLGVGEWARVEAQCMRFKEAGLALDEQNFPAVVFRGKRRFFRAKDGKYLVGVVELGGVVILLGSTGASFVVVVRQGRRRHVIPTGAAHGLEVLNLDELLPELDLDAPPRDRRPRSAERPEQIGQVAEHHGRILHGDVPSPANERVSIPGVVRRGLRWLADRAAALAIHRPKAKGRAGARAKADPRRAVRRERGTRFVYRLIEILLRLGVAGCGDLVGRLSEIQAQILDMLPGEKISPQALSDALHRLHACKTCLVCKPSPRRWHVRLAGLTDWRTLLHRRFCKETQTAYRLEPEPLRADDPVPPSATAPGAADEGASETPPRATGTPTTATPPAADPAAPTAPPHEPDTSSSPQPSPDVEPPTTTARSSTTRSSTAARTATSAASKDPPPTTRSPKVEPTTAPPTVASPLVDPSSAVRSPDVEQAAAVVEPLSSSATSSPGEATTSAPAAPRTTPAGPSEPDLSARLVPPSAPSTQGLHQTYSQACTKVQVELEAVQRDSAADRVDPEELPPAAAMTVVATLATEALAQTEAKLAAVSAAAAREAEEHARALAQTQAELAAVRAAAAREAEEHAHERDLLLQENQRVAAAAAALSERADRLLDQLSIIADRVPDPAPA